MPDSVIDNVTQRNVHMIAVEAATIRLRSTSCFDMKPVRRNEPRQSSTVMRSKETFHLENENSPAITSVQEWSREETGVGPSIASGSHRLTRVETDLSMQARSSNVRWKLIWLSETKVTPAKASPNRRARSPKRLKPIAEKDPCCVF
jgi:hypothetical protein